MSAAASTPVDPEALNEACHLLSAPVVIIGAAVGTRRGGLTAAWITRVSHAPPLLLVSIGHERFTHELLTGSGHFSVSILREGQVDLGRHFGLQSQRDVNKWATVEHVLLGDQVPALARCSARFLCAITDRFGAGDHDCFVGEIRTAEVVDGGPALPLRGEDYLP